MSMARIARLLGAGVAVVALSLIAGGAANAFPKFAAKEKVSCIYCHATPGGPRNFRGLYYKAHQNSFADFDETREAKAAGVEPKSMGPDAMAVTAGYDGSYTAPAGGGASTGVLSYTVKDIHGKDVKLSKYRGMVILIVNVASKCGNTPQYASLEKLYAKYKLKGFTILGFPANDFGKQEPGTNQEIEVFCKSTYNVDFPMFSKIVVKGDGQAPLYKFLTDKTTDPKFGGDIDWNFAKFLVNRKGEVVARYKASADPLKSAEIVAAIEKELAAPNPTKTAE